MCCVVCVVNVVCVLCGVGAVWLGFLFHGFMEWGFTCGCWFQSFGLVMCPWTALPWKALLLDRPKFRSFFPSPASKFVLFSSLCGSSRGILVVFFEGREAQMCAFGLSGCRVKPRRLSGPHSGVPTLRAPPLGAPPCGLTLCGPKIQHPKIGRSRNWPKSIALHTTHHTPHTTHHTPHTTQHTTHTTHTTHNTHNTHNTQPTQHTTHTHTQSRFGQSRFWPKSVLAVEEEQPRQK